MDAEKQYLVDKLNLAWVQSVMITSLQGQFYKNVH